MSYNMKVIQYEILQYEINHRLLLTQNNWLSNNITTTYWRIYYWTSYYSEWSLDKPHVASVVQGFVTTNQVGTCIITDTISNNLEEQTQTIAQQFFIEVKSPIATKLFMKLMHQQLVICSVRQYYIF